ncbi:MAG: hypothetical protein ACRDY0_01915 [Acidimicrobiales bacterium]
MIQKRGGRWRVVVQAGRDPLTGRRLQLSGSARTERDAVRLGRQLRIEAEDSVAGNITLAELVDQWWATRGSRRRWRSTTGTTWRTTSCPSWAPGR